MGHCSEMRPAAETQRGAGTKQEAWPLQVQLSTRLLRLSKGMSAMLAGTRETVPTPHFMAAKLEIQEKKKGTSRPRPHSVLVADSLFHLDFAGVRFVTGGGVTGPVPEQV